MQGGKQKSPLGYTIIELMIVLAVSGVMFLMASTFINGRQQRVAFTQSVNEISGRIQALSDQVTDGQYTDVPFTCEVVGGVMQFYPGGASSADYKNAGSKVQGTSTDCVFMGKLWHVQAGGDATKYNTYSLAGTRLDSLGNPPSNFAGAQIAAVDDAVNITRKEVIPHGLSIKTITITDVDGAVQSGTAFGFVPAFASTNSGSYVSGAQSFSLVYSSVVATGTEDQVTAATFGYARSVQLCLTDGVRYATITLGGQTSQLGIDTVLGASPC